LLSGPYETNAKTSLYPVLNHPAHKLECQHSSQYVTYLILNIKPEVVLPLPSHPSYFYFLLDLQDSNAVLQVISFAYNDFESFLLCLNNSIDDPLSTRLTISNISFLMRTHKGCRGYYAKNDLFRRWRENPRNPLYSLHTVEGIVIVHNDEQTADMFLVEVQQFIHYISQQNWPLDDFLSARVKDRFNSIWAMNADEPSIPFHDPGERWFSDRESLGSDGDEEGDDEGFEMNFEDYLTAVVGEEEDNGSLDLLEEREAFTEEDMIAYFSAAEEAGLASQDRRRNARRLGMENGNQRVL